MKGSVDSLMSKTRHCSYPHAIYYIPVRETDIKKVITLLNVKCAGKENT